MPISSKKAILYTISCMLFFHSLTCLDETFASSADRQSHAEAILPPPSPNAQAQMAKVKTLLTKSSPSLLNVYECNDPQTVITLLDTIVSNEPTFSEAFFWRGLAKSMLEMHEEAFEDLTIAIRLTPTAETYAYRGYISLQALQFSAAKHDLMYSLQLDPEQSQAWIFLGLMAVKESEYSQACEYFTQACVKNSCEYLQLAQKSRLCL